MKYLRLIDNYSVAPTLSLNHNQSHYKSVGGGITTIIAYTLSLAYAINVLVNSQNEENMGTVSQMENSININESIDHIFKGTVMNIYFKKRDDSEIDPFNQANLMFIPRVYNNNQSSIKYPNQLSQLNTQQVQVQGGQLSYSQNSNEQMDLQILLTKCSEKNKLQNQTCAQESDINEFLAYGLNTFVLEFFVHQISPKDGKLKSITKTIYLTLDVQSSQNIQITYRKTEASVDDGFFVSNEKNSDYVNNIQIITLSINQDKLDSYYKDIVYVLFELKLDSLITEVQVNFPKFGDYLSEVWAMVSMILTIGEFMRILNSRYLDDEMLMGIIRNYYPSLDKIHINYDIFKRIKSVVTVDNNYDIDHFKQQIEQLKQKAQMKLNYNNLFYEISRLQLLIQSLILDRQQIYKIKSMGIPFLNTDNSLVEEGNYIDEDFTILSMNTNMSQQQQG